MESLQRMKRTFVLVPGAGGMAWYWHRVVPLLNGAGHEAIAVDLPGDDDRAGLRDYADLVVQAVGERRDIVLVAQSLGAFTAPLVCARAHVGALAFVNAMIPRPGETPGAWFDDTGARRAREETADRGGYAREFDVDTYFLHDVPQSVLRDGPRPPREQSGGVFAEPCAFDAWPAIPMVVIASRDDRFFPLDFQRRLAAARLAKEVAVIPGGHLVALSNPRGLAEQLLAVSPSAPHSGLGVDQGTSSP